MDFGSEKQGLVQGGAGLYSVTSIVEEHSSPCPTLSSPLIRIEPSRRAEQEIPPPYRLQVPCLSRDPASLTSGFRSKSSMRTSFWSGKGTKPRSKLMLFFPA